MTESKKTYKATVFVDGKQIEIETDDEKKAHRIAKAATTQGTTTRQGNKTIYYPAHKVSRVEVIEAKVETEVEDDDTES